MAGSSSSKSMPSKEEENSAFEEFITHYDDSSDEEVWESFEEQPAALWNTFKSKAEVSTWEKKDKFPLDKITKENVYGNYLGRKLLYCKEVQKRYYEVKREYFRALVFYDKDSVIRNFKNWVEECLKTTFNQIYDDFPYTRFESYIQSGASKLSRKAKDDAQIANKLYIKQIKKFIDLAAEDPRKFYRKFVLLQSVIQTNWDDKLKELLNAIFVDMENFIPKSTLHSQLESFIMKYEIFKNQELLEKHFIHMRNMANEGIFSFENRENALVTVRTANRLARRAIKNNTGFANKIPLPVFHVFKYQFSKHPNSAAIEIEEINKNLARISHVKSVTSYSLIPGMINIVKKTLQSYHTIEYNDQDFAYWIELCLKGQSFDNWPKLDTPLVLKDYNSKLIGCLQFVSALTALLFYVEPKRNPSAFVYNLLVLDLVKKGKCEWECLASVEPENDGGIMPMSKGGATCLSRWIHNAFNIPESGLGKYIYKGPLKSTTVIGGITENLESILEKETKLVEKWLSINKTYKSLKDLLAEFYFHSLTQQMSKLSV